MSSVLVFLGVCGLGGLGTALAFGSNPHDPRGAGLSLAGVLMLLGALGLAVWAP